MSPAAGHQAVYVIDASCVIGLENAHGNGQTLYSAEEQQSIWTGLSRLASVGRLKVVYRVPEEVLIYTEVGYNKLNDLPKTGAGRNARIANRHREITQNHPEWEAEPGEPEPADPWIVAFASVRGWEVLTDEKRLSEQSNPNPNSSKIPDVCDHYGIDSHKLRDFAVNQGWIP